MLIKRFLPRIHDLDVALKNWKGDRESLLEWLEYHVIAPFVNQLIQEMEKILLIDPGQKEEEILQSVTGMMVQMLG
ncbi:MAG: hypothetical protein ACK4WB_05975, partial [Desulfatiglandales bacterium]